MAYDATVLAGTQGMRNHAEDRPACWASRWISELPVVLFAEGGGGRPGDVDMPIVAGLHVEHLCQLCASERARCPVIGMVSRSLLSRAMRHCWAAAT
jgi:acetyl-CoA carboxylase carboxyltransferase component